MKRLGELTFRIASILLLLGSGSAQLYAHEPIQRIFGKIELGEYIDSHNAAVSFNLPNRYSTERSRESSIYAFRTPIEYFGEVWDEVLVEYQNDTHECSAVFFQKKYRASGHPLNAYDAFRRRFDSLYGESDETSSEDSSGLTSMWRDDATFLILRIVRDKSKSNFNLEIVFGDIL